MRKLRLPTTEELAQAKANTPLLERSVIEAQWAKKHPQHQMYGSQQMMLIVLMAYMQSPLIKDYMTRSYLPEPLIFSLGLRSGASTLIQVIREAYPDLVRVVSVSKELQLILGGDCFSMRSKTKPNFKDKIVIFDGNFHWHDRKFIDHVRSSMPICYISFGS